MMHPTLATLMVAKDAEDEGRHDVRARLLDTLVDVRYVRGGSRSRLGRLAIMPPRWLHWQTRRSDWAEVGGTYDGDLYLWRWPNYRPLEWR